MKDEAFEKLKKEANPFICSECRKNFRPANPYQIYCSEQCENVKKKILEDKNDAIYNRTCNTCGLSFRRKNETARQQRCDVCIREAKRESNRECLKKKPKKEKIKKPKKLVSYDELNRREEYKRVYGKGAWDHYTKGRKWDRI